MSKEVIAKIKLEIVAGQASPAPPVGPALGQHGVNIMGFVREFNERTKKMDEGTVVPVLITVFKDKSFNFVVKTPPASYLLKKAAGIAKGSGAPEQGQGRQGHHEADRGDRPDQAPRPQRLRHRGGQEDHRGDGQKHGIGDRQ